MRRYRREWPERYATVSVCHEALRLEEHGVCSGELAAIVGDMPSEQFRGRACARGCGGVTRLEDIVPSTSLPLGAAPYSPCFTEQLQRVAKLANRSRSSKRTTGSERP